jgi:hypothetical protein
MVGASVAAGAAGGSVAAGAAGTSVAAGAAGASVAAGVQAARAKAATSRMLIKVNNFFDISNSPFVQQCKFTVYSEIKRF